MPAPLTPCAPRILVVDDHRKIREPLAVYLRRHAFEVRTTEDAAGMWQLLKTQPFDVVILDVLLPDGDGFELCHQLHRQSNIPVILLTARDTAADRVRGLDLGADDYLTKPFEPRELVARINSVLRRRGTGLRAAVAAPEPLAARDYHFAGWHFSASRGLLTRLDAAEVRLSTVEGRLLQVFLDHPNALLPRERLIELTAAPDSDVSDRTIDRQVSRLRRKLAVDGATAELLRTVWGSGYRLAAEVTVRTP